MQITANACRDELRRLKRRPVVPLESLPYDPPALSTESPEDYALRQETGEHVQRGLTTLSHEQRMAVILCDIQGLSYEEVAEVMECSLGTVKSRINRGRSRLRDYFVKMELISPELRHSR
jgi:RNA polymerase sigma-70 factor (ECF subfamily)